MGEVQKLRKENEKFKPAVRELTQTERGLSHRHRFSWLTVRTSGGTAIGRSDEREIELEGEVCQHCGGSERRDLPLPLTPLQKSQTERDEEEEERVKTAREENVRKMKRSHVRELSQVSICPRDCSHSHPQTERDNLELERLEDARKRLAQLIGDSGQRELSQAERDELEERRLAEAKRLRDEQLKRDDVVRELTQVCTR